MIIDIKEFTSTVSKISAFASGEKNVPGVLLDVRENEIAVCYSDGRKSVIETIGVELEEGETPIKIAVNYQRLVDILAVCQPTGRIVTDSIKITFESDKTLRLIAEKKIPEIAEGEDEPTYRVVSVANQTLGYDVIGENVPMKYGMLTRMDYAGIFKGENPDTWDIQVLKGILDNLATEKGRTVYVSPAKSLAFVSNTAYMSAVPIDTGSYQHAILANTAVAKSLSEILNKLSGNVDTVKVSLQDKKYACIFTEDEKTGIWFEMAVPDKIHLATLSRYEEKKYQSYQVTFMREVLKNVIDSAVLADKADKTVLKFNKNKTGEMELRIDSINAGASINNTYSVVCAGCEDKNGDIEKFELPVSLKLIGEILGKCSEDYVALDIDIDANDVRGIRLADISLQDRMDEETNLRKELGIGDSEVIPQDERLELRAKTLLGKHYATSNR